MGRHGFPALRGRGAQERGREAAAAGVQRLQRGAVHHAERDLHLHRAEQLDQQQRQHREVRGDRRQQPGRWNHSTAHAGFDRTVRLVAILLCCSAAAAQSRDAAAHIRAAAQATRDHRFVEAVAELSTATALAPTLPAGWYALGQAYSDVAKEAARTFDRNADDAAWRRLLAADGLFAAGRFVDAFTLYRSALDSLPAMVSVHDSIARIYERTGHAEWAAREREAGARVSVDCVTRKALCEFRSGRYRAALDA